MKLNNILKGIIVGVVLLSFGACQDFLHRPTEDGYNVDNFYLNDLQVEQGVNYLYNSPWYDFQRAFIKIGEVMSGNMYWGNSPYLSFTTNSTDVDLVNMSYSLWSVNSHVNTVIDNIVASSGPSQAAKNKAIGEALTWKAMAYFYMVRTFGEVPIIHSNREVLTSGTYNDVYKVKSENVYEYIIMTLEKAMELLPKQTSGWNGRIDYYAAEALLAKVYLTRAGISGTLDTEDLKQAALHAENVILKSGRSLTPKYSDVFRLSPSVHNATGESLIAWQWESASGRWTAQNTLQSDLIFEGFSEFGDLWGGWGGPSYDLALAFGADPLKDPKTRLTEKDTRRKATMMMPGDVYEYFWTNKTDKLGNKGFNYLYFLYSGDEEYAEWGSPGEWEGPCGSQNVKHLFGNGADHLAGTGVSAARMAYQLPTHLLRLSDIYLVYAEAKLLTGEADTALEYVNKVRVRAHNGDTSAELDAITFEDIWKERRLELAGEGDRWYDFVRRSYYDMNAVIAELTAQKRNSIYGFDGACKAYWKSGCSSAEDLTSFDPNKAQWSIEGITDNEGQAIAVAYDEGPAAPNVTASSFTLPFPAEDVVFNKHLVEEAQDVDVRATYVYNF